jgi:hypothetical protein
VRLDLLFIWVSELGEPAEAGKQSLALCACNLGIQVNKVCARTQTVSKSVSHSRTRYCMLTVDVNTMSWQINWMCVAVHALCSSEAAMLTAHEWIASHMIDYSQAA